ncbi:Uncharacterized conserved protein YjiS, DUF1127 family [Mesorhizobium albiziae]|uniref:Uncharacterized conserved protein YjiS, DUF1127 family n=1 Tax=Neomesorhizobium albiziae TaxID=335020 RepID=A0A1I3VUB5_9HYPH|nr:DUF1127 domain-containing protein [Mesorhizobium albiziae]GLS29132.1 hypothetical protein GCM10007937_08390 [Mesorhizobium albiziae]SFJ97877.1 Uncharacterized conserved protein YjiS, DUF1127 family [Mesorhizobium albiziae]
MSISTLNVPVESTGRICLTRLGQIWRAYRSARDRHNGVRALEAMNDELLKDIGITRSQILSAVNGSHGNYLPNGEG